MVSENATTVELFDGTAAVVMAVVFFIKKSILSWQETKSADDRVSLWSQKMGKKERDSSSFYTFMVLINDDRVSTQIRVSHQKPLQLNESLHSASIRSIGC